MNNIKDLYILEPEPQLEKYKGCEKEGECGKIKRDPRKEEKICMRCYRVFDWNEDLYNG